jgi:cell wall-associated NlpC family hydrolase
MSLSDITTFSVAEERNAVVSEALSWIGTPYHHHGRVKAVGVDCAMFLAEVFERTGVVPHVNAGFYPHDWHMHRGEELFLGWLARIGAERTDAPLPGDIAVFRDGRTFSHGAIVIGPQTVVHSYLNRGVQTNRLDEEPIAGREVQFWSPLWAAKKH